jgi:hypothetical protein
VKLVAVQINAKKVNIRAAETAKEGIDAPFEPPTPLKKVKNLPDNSPARYPRCPSNFKRANSALQLSHALTWE